MVNTVLELQLPLHYHSVIYILLYYEVLVNVVTANVEVPEEAVN